MNAIFSSPGSLVWQQHDLQLGSHAFQYGSAQYDGLIHTHGEYSIVTCTEGSMTVHSPGTDRLLSAGETLVVNPGEPHRCTFGSGGVASQGLTLLVKPQLLSAFCREINPGGYQEWSLPVFGSTLREPELVIAAQRIAGECAARKAGFDLVVELLAKQMLVQVLRAWPRESISHNDGPLAPQLPWLHMHRATVYMNAYGKGEFRLSELCQEIGLSSSRFIPLFRNSARLSPHEYYNHLLVFKAQRLREAGCTSKEIAYSLGFRNSSHFCSLYHRLTGTSPRVGDAHQRS